MSENQKKQLEQQLWNVANTLRGKMNADEFRDYILGFIFYKYLSERMEIYANEILETDGIKYKEINENAEDGKAFLEAIKEESVEKLGYFLKPSELFSEVAKRGNGDKDEDESNFILEDLQKILTNIQQSTMGTESEEDFDHLFEDMDLNSTKLGKTPEARNGIIAKVLAHLDKIDFKLEQSELDVLGDAYEYLIGQFASGAGKKAGEFYTPQQVSTILAKIVTTGKKKLKYAYDPTFGSGSLILRVAKEVEVTQFFGQELNRTTYNLARMNMILHGINYRRFNIKQEDTLEHPQHLGMEFEAIVANPPFSAQWSANPLFTSDDRFSQYGKLAPSSKADFAFVQHMIHHLAENGTMAVVLPHGVLYRGGAELHIRKYLIKDRNYLDAVIGLPENIFYGTDIATCILVFKKCRENPNDVLFIDGSSLFGKSNKQNYLRHSDIEKIISTYRNRNSEDRYSYKASTDEIYENDFFLNIPRYVKNIKKEKSSNLYDISNLLYNYSIEQVEIDEKLKLICIELNVPVPSSFNVLKDIIKQKIRFKNDNGNFYSEWKPIKLQDLLIEHKERNTEGKHSEVFSVAKEKGIINQIEHLGRSYASEDISNYKIVYPYDVVYTKSPTAGFPFGIIKQNKTQRTGVVSVLYAVFRPKNEFIGLLLDYYFSSEVNTFNYLNPIVNKGAKNTMNINNDAFLNGLKIVFPTDVEEIKKVTGFINLLDRKFNIILKQAELLQEYKNGFLTNLFEVNE
ncbi:MAG: type I restriction-modification system subunit M [Sphingobacteriaceae bacterium]|nr:MAG: type I restriction-modification system subunit M [Sphingobacteriaceae bacterium]